MPSHLRSSSLSVTGGIATIGALADIVEPATAAARAVEDKFTAIKIRSIDTFPQVSHNLVKIETWECISYLQNNCIDIFQCDAGQGGGITPMRKVAALCEAYHVPIAPHSTLSNLGISASLQTVGSVPNFLIQELYPNDLKGVLHATFEQDKNYDYSLPQGPGLGCEVDEELAKKNAKLFGYKYHWPKQSYSDGSVIDY